MGGNCVDVRLNRSVVRPFIPLQSLNHGPKQMRFHRSEFPVVLDAHSSNLTTVPGMRKTPQPNAMLE